MVVDRCLAKNPDDRYATGEALADALEQAYVEGARHRCARAGVSLPPGLPERVNEAQASAIWRRAAQLQADALHRLDARDSEPRTRAASGADGPCGARRDNRRAGSDAGAAIVSPTSAAAAEEAGISRQYVAMALAELPRGALPVGGGARRQRAHGDAPPRHRCAERRRHGRDTGATGSRALARSAPCCGSRRTSSSCAKASVAHPLDGGVLVFDLPSARTHHRRRSRRSWPTSTGWVRDLQLEARQLQVTLAGRRRRVRSHGGDDDRGPAPGSEAQRAGVAVDRRRCRERNGSRYRRG